MPRFLLIFRGGTVVNATMPPVDRHAQIERWAAWTRELQSAGHHVPGGVPARPLRRSVSASRDAARQW
jgi:hypothetical protein